MTRTERFQQARESLDEALLFAREGMGPRAVMTKLYHAMLFSLVGFLGIAALGDLTHEDVVTQFRNTFLGSSPDDARVAAALQRAYDLTHECECDCMPIPTEADLAEVQWAAERLLAWAETVPLEEVKEHENSVV